MTTVFNFQISSEGVFPNKKVDVPSFTEEIQASSITAVLVSVEIVGDLCVVTFATDLSAAEELTLSNLVQAHTAAKVGEPHMLPYIWQVKNPVANLAATAMKVIGLAGTIDEYNMMRPGVPTGVNIRMKNALTQGTLTVTVTKNNVATSKSKTITVAMGKKTLWLMKTTDVSLLKSDSIGLQYSTSADMLPTGDNELVCNIEAAWMS